MNSRFIDETLDYKLIVQQSVASKVNGHLVYAIVNKETDVVEAEVPFLVQGYEGLHEMQASLDNWRDKFDQKKREQKEESEILIN
jgi:hypothetical protein|tara:strand:- start:17510 stop:17764 length:255 start_codon:yes stop_codon:yes gene_type:complete